MNKKDIYRNLIFILATTVGGVVLIYLLFAFVNNPFKDADFKAPKTSNKQKIQDEINNFDNISFDSIHSNLPILLTKISSSGNHGLIQKSTMNYFSDQLMEKYRQRIFSHCGNVLLAGSNYGTLGHELSELEKVIGKDDEIDYYRDQINMLDYYTYRFHEELKRYIGDYAVQDNILDAHFYYDDEIYFLKSQYDGFSTVINDNYIVKAETTPGLEYKYKNEDLKNNLNILVQQLKKIKNNFIKIQLL